MVTVKQRGLGKGLSALISEPQAEPRNVAATATARAGHAPHEMSISKLLPGKYQPRTRFTQDQLQELAQSIERNGMMQPIIVRSSRDVPERYEIVAGERRWRAAKLAGLAQVPVIIREINDQQALELALVENIQRQDLNPLEEATGFQRLIDEFSYTQEELASTIGKSRSHIANLLRLLALPEEVKKMLEEGELTMGHARALLSVPDPLAAAREIVRKGMSVRQAERLSRDHQGVEKQSRPRSSSPRKEAASGEKDGDIIALEESLAENLGVRVNIQSQGQGGEITLGYDTLAQLDEILRRLSSNA